MARKTIMGYTFPADATVEEMQEALRSVGAIPTAEELRPPPTPEQEEFARFGTGFLPLLGGTLGTFTSPVTGPAGPIGGALAGRKLQEHILSELGLGAPDPGLVRSGLGMFGVETEGPVGTGIDIAEAATEAVPVRRLATGGAQFLKGAGQALLTGEGRRQLAERVGKALPELVPKKFKEAARAARETPRMEGLEEVGRGVGRAAETTKEQMSRIGRSAENLRQRMETQLEGIKKEISQARKAAEARSAKQAAEAPTKAAGRRIAAKAAQKPAAKPKLEVVKGGKEAPTKAAERRLAEKTAKLTRKAPKGAETKHPIQYFSESQKKHINLEDMDTTQFINTMNKVGRAAKEGNKEALKALESFKKEALERAAQKGPGFKIFARKGEEAKEIALDVARSQR